MTSSTTTDSTPFTITPLRPRPDQRERWITHATPIVFEEAAQQVLDVRISRMVIAPIRHRDHVGA